ncbi:uncharacterized protein RAG0_01038 [Rhynchosporium agropyri]|uniref:Hsp70 protein n=1 Tax=Rhynchosporium agropyri TaxID=914238 RepID=A0A1E1JVT0_9HELO|nr:uncharacterized protein RAG0_01038 [Rhynchosporium agropyri]
MPPKRSHKKKETVAAGLLRQVYPDDIPMGERNEAPAEQYIGKLYIGIDMGTTQCAVATAEVFYPPHPRANQTPRVILFEGWNGTYQDGSQKRTYPSTSMYYQEDGTAVTGHDVEVLEKLQDPSVFKPARHIRLWKLMLHETHGDLHTETIQARIQAQLDSLGLTSDDLVRDWASYIFHVLGVTANGDKSMLKSQYDNFDRLEKIVVIAVPPGRTTIAHAQVTQAFVQAPLTSTSVSLESEPAAMFRSWVENRKDDQDWVEGSTYLVVDGGGGTCCFVRFRLDRLNPLGFTQEFASESVICGAETISDSIEKLIALQVPPNHKHRDWEISRMRNDFEAMYKYNIGSEVLHFDEIAFKRSDCLDSFVKIPMPEVEKCFDSCTAKLIPAMQRQLDKSKLGEKVFIIVGGGLFQNPLILSTMHAAFPALRIIQVSKKKGDVAIGCVLSRINGGFFTRYPITTTKAITTLQVVTPKIRRSKYYPSLHTKQGDFDGREYFWCAEYLVRKGEQTAAGQGISSESSLKDARKRYIDPGETSADYCETILTFTHQPESKDLWAGCCKDGSWIDERGDAIPDPVHSEAVHWNPYRAPDDDDQTHGIAVADLDSERSSDKKTYKIIRYSLELLVNEVGTSIWQKVFSSKKIKKTTRRNVAFVSRPILREPLYTHQAISQSLADSFELDISRKKDESEANRERSVSESIEPQPESSQKFPSVGCSTKLKDSHSSFRFLHKNTTTIPAVNENEDHVEVPVSCWSCALQDIHCEVRQDNCVRCKQAGIACGGGTRPRWWNDHHIRKEQVVLLNNKIRESRSGERHEARQPLDKSRDETAPSLEVTRRRPVAPMWSASTDQRSARIPTPGPPASFPAVNRLPISQGEDRFKTPGPLKRWREPPIKKSYSSMNAFPARRPPERSLRPSSFYPSPDTTPPGPALPSKNLSNPSLTSYSFSHNNDDASSPSLQPSPTPKPPHSYTSSPDPRRNPYPDRESNPDIEDSDDEYIGPPLPKRHHPISPGKAIRGRSRRSRRVDTQRKRDPEMKSWNDEDVCIEEVRGFARKALQISEDVLYSGPH